MKILNPPTDLSTYNGKAHSIVTSQAFQDLAKYNISSWPTFQSRILLRLAKSFTVYTYHPGAHLTLL